MHRLLLPFVVLLLFAGCLEFDGQEITIVHDAKADRIDVHVVYRGLYASTDPGRRGDHVARAADDLAANRRGGVVSLFGAWPVAFDPTKADARAPDLAGHIDVETGPLFTDAEGLLCAQQFVRIRSARAFLEKLDRAMKTALQQNLAGADGKRNEIELDDDSLAAIEAFCRTGERFVLVEPGRIEVRLPLSDRDHARMREQLVGALAEHVADELDPAAASKPALRKAVRRTAVVRVLAGNEFSMVRETNLTRVAVGVKGAERLRLTKPLGDRREPALHDHLVANGAAFEQLRDDELERRFAAFRTRDAVLAPDLAAARAARK